MQVLAGSPISSEAMTALGLEDVAYVRPVEHHGRQAYAVCLADGSVLAIATSIAGAFGLIRQHELEPSYLH